MLICLLALVIGVCAALFVPAVIPSVALPYVAVGILGLVWALSKAILLLLNKKMNFKIFIFGLFCGLILIMLFIFAGGKLNLDIYPVCILVLAAGFLKNCYEIFKHYTGNKNVG